MTTAMSNRPPDTDAPAEDPEFERQGKIAEAILRRYRNAFRVLAK